MKFPFPILSKAPNLDYIKYRWVGFIASGLLVLFTFFQIFTGGLNFGIDFLGGLVMEVKAEKTISLENMRKSLSATGFEGTSLQNLGTDREIQIRTQLPENVEQKIFIEKLKTTVAQAAGSKVEFRKVDFVGPQVGAELKQKAVVALAVSLACMMAYLWFRFNWQYGVGGLAALFHDAVAMLCFYIVTGLEFDLTSIAAVLTIVGYSIMDSVVIYDRIRENLRKYKKKPLPELINLSVNETLSRTILTSCTTLIACLALVMFGGEVIRGFSLAMFFGVLFGTYSSIFISAPILIYTGVRKE